MPNSPDNLHNSILESEAIFQKRIQDLVSDLSEAESRTHNHRFVDNRFRRRFTIRFETFIRRNRFLFKVALKVKNLL